MDRTVAGSAQEVPVIEDVEVVLRHPSFGEYAFRAKAEDVAGSIEQHIADARAEAARRQQIADLDGKQLEIAGKLAKADERIGMATELGDEAAIQRETDAKAALQAESDAVVARRAALQL